MYPETDFLSDRVGELAKDVIKFKQYYCQIWQETETDFPPLGRIYTRKNQKKIENELSRFVDKLSNKISLYPSEEGKKKIWLEDFIEDFRTFGKQVLEVSDVYLDSVFSDEYVNSTRDFVENVKKFDPSLKIENVYQALRNVWIMNSLQIYLDLEIKHSDAIFAYSMLYPYTDNYFDNISHSDERKFSLTENLKNWLEGENPLPKSPQEEKIFKLIKTIEKQYSRNLFPGVYQSLLAIFNAQIKSLNLQKADNALSERNILDISFEKGGTSVLADGFLVKGSLAQAEADFCFGFGAFLQFGDDIQDLVEDKENDHMTIFSQSEEKDYIDNLASRLINFASRVVDSKLEERNPNRKVLKELIVKNFSYLVLEAIGKNKSYFSGQYVQKIQQHFPVRFSYLKTLRKKLKDRFLDDKKFAIDLDLASAFLLTATSRTIYGK